MEERDGGGGGGGVTVSVSVKIVWRDLPLSHPLLVGGVVWSFLTSDPWLKLDHFQVMFHDSGLRSTFSPPTSLHCLSHSL